MLYKLPKQKPAARIEDQIAIAVMLMVILPTVAAVLCLAIF